MFTDLITIFLGLFVGFYASLLGSGGGGAILVYFLQHLKIINTTTMIAGTMLFVSSIPLGIFGLPNFYKNGDINFYVGGLVVVGLIAGIIMGSKYTYTINNTFGEKLGEKIKNGITGTVYAMLTILYLRATIYDGQL
jgi:uncharacterized membrane protein YfcA